MYNLSTFYTLSNIKEDCTILYF